MRIITVYSYKGGVGKSVSILNLCFLLSRKYKQRIGLIDLDAESAGLSQILNMNVSPDEELLHFLQKENRNVKNLRKYVHTVKALGPGGAEILILPAIGNSEKLASLQWDESVSLFLRDEVFPHYRELYRLDYLLIDGRAGISPFSDAAIKYADLVLLFCRMDRQNAYGTKRMIDGCKAVGKDYLVIVSHCPKVQGYRKKLDEFDSLIGHKHDLLIPYEPRLYFGEYITTYSKPKSRLSGLYEGLAGKIHNAL
jgi:MinD-like ATPase involved in chromosome partitioning or flagellar assembly